MAVPSSVAERDPPATQDLHPPRALLEIAETLDGAGHDVWAVGGAVRDALAGLPGSDWDLATGATPQVVRRLFRRTVPLGIEHGTVGVPGSDGTLYEVTTFRRDVETFGRHATVAFADTIEEDLARRDFTINAIAWHPLRRELRDPWHGLDDLRAGVLRTVGDPADRFAEDYLRVLRAIRFAGRFDLRIEPPTWDALRAAVEHLDVLSAERIRDEILKILAGAAPPSRALHLFAASGALGKLLPEVAATAEIELDDDTNLWARTMAAVDAVSRRRVLTRMAALLQGIGYPAARMRDLRGGWRYTGHEQWAARRADEILRRLRFSNADRERVVALVARQSDLFPPDAPPAGIRRWLLRVPPDLVRDLFRLRIALFRAQPTPGGDRDLTERWRKAHAVLLEHPAIAVGDLAIGGHDLRELGIEPGPVYGRILEALLHRVMEDPSLNRRDWLLEQVRDGVGQEP